MRKHLTYSTYVNDKAIIEALRLPEAAEDYAGDWPGMPAGWTPGDAWPRGESWPHHEVHFIRVHQAFEVWFALVIHEVDSVLASAADWVDGKLERVHLEANRTDEAMEFPPDRFPKLSALASRLSDVNRSIGDAVRTIPSPGRHRPRSVRPAFSQSDSEDLRKRLKEWSRRLHRAVRSLEVCLPFFDVLETLEPRDFLEFRGRLNPASGFGSQQFREIELLLGLRESNAERFRRDVGGADPGDLSLYKNHLPSDEDWRRLRRRFEEAALRDLVYDLLNGIRFESEDEVFDEWATCTVEQHLAVIVRTLEAVGPSHPRVEHEEFKAVSMLDGLREFLSHRESLVVAMLTSSPWSRLSAKNAALVSFLEICTELDNAFLRWRDRHIRFVEKMIGRRPGTGGTGVEYLRDTVDAHLALYRTHAFPCLWQARSLVQYRREDDPMWDRVKFDR